MVKASVKESKLLMLWSVYCLGEEFWPEHKIFSLPKTHKVNLTVCFSLQKKMDDQEDDQLPRVMFEHMKPNLDVHTSSINQPVTEVEDFKFEASITQVIQQFVQFEGSREEDPNTHIINYLEICDTFKIRDASDDAISFKLFPFSLKSKTKNWLNSLERWSTNTWEAMVQKFLNKYFQPAKSAKLRVDISSSVQKNFETLYDSWKHYKELIRKCSNHGLPLRMQVWTFYNCLNMQTR